MKLKLGELLSNFAFNFNMRPYSMGGGTSYNNKSFGGSIIGGAV